jgi:hypothetical protein
MNAIALITFWQLAGVVLPIVGAIAAASFLVWCVVGLALWVSKRGLDDSVQPATDPDWFEAL